MVYYTMPLFFSPCRLHQRESELSSSAGTVRIGHFFSRLGGSPTETERKWERVIAKQKRKEKKKKYLISNFLILETQNLHVVFIPPPPPLDTLSLMSYLVLKVLL